MLNRTLTALLIAPVLVVAGLAYADHHEAGEAPAEIPVEEPQWVDLYNGENLDGWRTTGNWVPQEDGVLAIVPRQGENGWQRYQDYLYTEQTYGDYELSLEYRLERGGNSGLHFRIAAVEDWANIDPVAAGIECQIMDSFGKPDERMGHHDCGGIIRTQGPSRNMSLPAGEWNTMVIRCEGQHITVQLNGVQIIDIQQDEGAMADRPLVGHIALQDHGIPAWFRNIRIRELN